MGNKRRKLLTVKRSKLLVIQGPTGVGKTELTLRLAQWLGCPILNADSRQVYRDMPIGTAAPTPEQLERVKHYFVGFLSPDDDYNAGQYEREALALLEELFKEHETVILSGGSMMYVDAVCRGFDDLPKVNPDIRTAVQHTLQTEGLEALQQQLMLLDPDYYRQVDLQNPRRVSHAVELCLQTGKRYSQLRTGQARQRHFGILKVGLDMPRELLYERINNRVDKMIEDGLLEEAERLLTPYIDRELPNSLNTVGYKELYKVLKGEWSLDYAISMIKQDTRHYAKRPLTWLRHDPDIHWININDYENQTDIITAIINMLGSMQP